MELTREEAIRLHRELWKWLAENPMKEKADWPGWSKAGYAENHCFCCEYVKYFSADGCKSCPVVWQDAPTCAYENSFYRKWKQATAPEERSRLAALIRDLPEKKVEPKALNRCPVPKTITETTTYKFKGAKTICIIENERGKFKGVAKCSPQDEWQEQRGMALAKIRAQEAMIRAE